MHCECVEFLDDTLWERDIVTIMSHESKVESYSGHFQTLNVLEPFMKFKEN